MTRTPPESADLVLTPVMWPNQEMLLVAEVGGLMKMVWPTVNQHGGQARNRSEDDQEGPAQSKQSEFQRR